MAGILIHNPGLLTTIQDRGRYGFRRFGMPSSGAMDHISLSCANWLVGNDLNEAVIEATVIGPEIEFLNSCRFAVTGAGMNPELNGNPVNEWTTIKARKKDVLKFGILEKGARAYIAVSGGIRTDEIMGSKSTYIPSKTGGIHGEALKKGDTIHIYPTISARFRERRIPQELIPMYQEETELSIVKGIDHSKFSNDETILFSSSVYTVTPSSNRIGYRLDGEKILASGGHDLLSRAVNYGTIQIPGDGLPIIMGADCQTTGGYLQIANIISADLHRLGQILPGNRIRFRLTDPDSAVARLKELEDKYKAVFGGGGTRICTDCIVYKH